MVLYLPSEINLRSNLITRGIVKHLNVYVKHSQV